MFSTGLPSYRTSGLKYLQDHKYQQYIFIYIYIHSHTVPTLNPAIGGVLSKKKKILSEKRLRDDRTKTRREAMSRHVEILISRRIIKIFGRSEKTRVRFLIDLYRILG